MEVLSSTYTCTYTCTAVVKDTNGTHGLNFWYKEPVKPVSNPDSDATVGSWGESRDCLHWAQSNHTGEFGYHTVTQNLKAVVYGSSHKVLNLHFYKQCKISTHTCHTTSWYWMRLVQQLRRWETWYFRDIWMNILLLIFCWKIYLWSVWILDDDILTGECFCCLMKVSSLERGGHCQGMSRVLW